MLRAIEILKLKQHLERYIKNNVKNQSRIILRLWTDHCEYILAQRFRRGQQMICLYRRMWDEQALRELFLRFRRQMQRHAKGLMFSGVGVASGFDWDIERIKYDSIRCHLEEIEQTERLRKDTIYCATCGKRLVIDYAQDGIVYCKCSNSISRTKNVVSAKDEEKPWQPYLERKNMIVWRREERPGLYAYKVYAVYKDVSAEDFLHVQIDTEYRKIWDQTAITLDVIDADPVHKGKSHIIYWEMLWPKLFANRDYVFKRRYFVDSSRKLIIIVNKSTTHPASPKKPNNQRVKDYWSYMVIRSTTNSFKQPGLEYVLTYFDNPGIVLPPTITSWVAQKQMPEFLNKLYMATVEYAQQRQQHQNEILKSWDSLPDPGFEYPPDPEFNYNTEEQEEIDDDDRGRGNGGGDIDPIDDCDDLDTNANKKSTSWWSYLIPFHYFA